MYMYMPLTLYGCYFWQACNTPHFSIIRFITVLTHARCYNKYIVTNFGGEKWSKMFKENLPQFLGSKAHGFYKKILSSVGKLMLKLRCILQPSIFAQKNLDITILAELILQLKRQEKDTNCLEKKEKKQSFLV